MKSLLNPPASIGVAIGTAGLVYAIYALNVPNIGVIHATTAHDGNVEAARKKAAIASAVAAAGVSILSRDLNPLIIGGSALILSDVYVRHANAVSPVDGSLVTTTEYGPSVPAGQPYADEYQQ